MTSKGKGKAKGKSVPSKTGKKVATNGPSGRFVVRVPSRLHNLLAMHAKEERVSMNLLVATLLAEGIGVRTHGAIINKAKGDGARDQA